MGTGEKGECLSIPADVEVHLSQMSLKTSDNELWNVGKGSLPHFLTLVCCHPN